MGIPAFFRKLIKEYPGVHFWRKEEIDHLYFDFNCLIYYVLRKGARTDEEVIEATLSYLAHIVELIAPRQSLYIALDGSAPRAKVVQQRARRFKRIIDRGVRQVFSPEGTEEAWDSRRISPGTPFMSALADAIRNRVQGFAVPKVTFSDSNVPGEGEHKCITSIRSLPEGETVALYGLDADLIVLAMSLGRPGMLILREPLDSEIERALYCDSEFLYLSIDAIRQGFLESLTAEGIERSPDRVLIDYTFITFLGGNDFVRPVTFLNIKEGGLSLMLDAYRTLLKARPDYLVNLSEEGDPPQINLEFFREFVESLKGREWDRLKRRQRGMERIARGEGNDEDRLERESKMTPAQVAISRFEHLPFYHPDHPLVDSYRSLFRDTIDYESEPSVWREQYYAHFFVAGLDRKKITRDYLKSLVYTLHYYFAGEPPSWDWYYPHRVAPLLGDLASTLKRFDRIEFPFIKGAPYEPFYQLALIMPQDGAYLLPVALRPLLEGSPTEFELDALAGGKYIYSEPLLEEPDERQVRSEYRRLLRKVSKVERSRNSLSTSPEVFSNYSI